MTEFSALTPRDTPADPYYPEALMGRETRRALTLIGVLLFGLGTAAAVVPIGGAVIGAGDLIVQSRVMDIAHPTGGTVAQILVSNGQHVRRGQLLARLDDRVSGTDAELSTLSVDQLLAQKARLEAEQSGASAIAFPATLTARQDDAARSAMADEQRLFALRRSEQSGMAAQLRARMGQYREQIGGYQAQIASLRQQSALIEPERQGVKSLYDRRLVTIGRFNQLEREAASIGGAIGALQAQIGQAGAQIVETREQLLQLGEARRSEAGTQLAAINAQLNQQRIRSVAALDAQSRTAIRATADGIVDRIALTTIGGVVRPAETIMVIVPDSDGLLVEGRISPADLDQVRVGNGARIRFAAISSTKTPEVEGKVSYIGADAVVDQRSGVRYFPVRIALPRNQLSRLPVKSGTPAEFFIQTGSRSMLSYITKPLRDQIARSFRSD
jgi:HlyD family secretion protein